MGGRYSCRFCGETRLTYDEFVVRHGTDPEWMKMLESHYFESDLRNALAGDPSGFRELTLRAPDHKAQPQIMQALWMAGIPVRPHRNSIKQIWKIESSLFVRAFGADLDAFLRDAGFNAGPLPDEFDVWRGGSESFEQMACGRSWTRCSCHARDLRARTEASSQSSPRIRSRLARLESGTPIRKRKSKEISWISHSPTRCRSRCQAPCRHSSPPMPDSRSCR